MSIIKQPKTRIQNQQTTIEHLEKIKLKTSTNHFDKVDTPNKIIKHLTCLKTKIQHPQTVNEQLEAMQFFASLKNYNKADTPEEATQKLTRLAEEYKRLKGYAVAKSEMGTPNYQLNEIAEKVMTHYTNPYVHTSRSIPANVLDLAEATNKAAQAGHQENYWTVSAASKLTKMIKENPHVIVYEDLK